ncbi:uncharacterized protein [Aegilops tauschii subsp. strangulata]
MVTVALVYLSRDATPIRRRASRPPLGTTSSVYRAKQRTSPILASMRPQALLAALVVVAVLAAALPLAHSQGATPSAWPCCDKCGSCTRSIPPLCTCMDMSPTGCNKACKTCAKPNSTLAGGDGFRCADRIANFCKRRCTPVA